MSNSGDVSKFITLLLKSSRLCNGQLLQPQLCSYRKIIALFDSLICFGYIIVNMLKYVHYFGFL